MSGIRSLSKELAKKASKEINEVPERIAEDLKTIKEWLNKSPHIRARMDDQWLLAFLRGSKYRIEKTKQKIEDFYNLKSSAPEIFHDRDPFHPEIQALLEQGICIPLQNTKDQTGPNISLLPAIKIDRNTKVESYFKTITMIGDIILNEDDVYPICGCYSVMDVSGFSTDFLVSPKNIKTMLSYQQAFPSRIKGLYFLNVHSVLDYLIRLFRSMTSAKISNRFHLYTNKNLDEISKNMPIEVLPNEYGGDAGPIKEFAAIWKKKVESYAEWFKDDEKYGVDEKLRPGKGKIIGNEMGAIGSFRKLNID